MRKYKMPKMLYAMLAIILIVLAVDYTYAYFSAQTTATGHVGVANISVQWYRSSASNLFGTGFKAGETIDISGNQLKRATFTTIQYNSEDITLSLSPTLETSVYCRIKLTASYKSITNEDVDCSADIKLAYNNTLLENSGSWTLEDDGYYYYKSNGTLTVISSSNSITVANQLYLDENSSNEIYGKAVDITLKAEMVQSNYVTVGTDVWIDETNS